MRPFAFLTMMRTLPVSIAAVVLICAGSPVQALETHERTNSVFGFTLGPGRAGIGLDLLDSGTIESEGQVGLGFGFRVGTMLRPDLALSFAGTGWTRRYENFVGQRLIPTTVTASVVGGAVTYYPAQSGFYVHAGLGLGTGSVSLIVSGFNFDKDKYGLGFLGGTGYEFRVMKNLAIGPAVDFGATRLGTSKLGGVTVDFDLTYVNFGISATWYSGPDKRRRQRPE